MKQRIVFLDNLRGFMFALMAFDHSIHAYAQDWGSKWFYKDSDRLSFWDYIYVFDQAIIMPMIFFIVGHFVIGAYERHGLKQYLNNRLVRYGIPFLLGIPLFLPLLTYPRYHDFTSYDVNFWTYATEIFFQERPQAGPFWVMQALILGTLLTLLVHRFLPKFLPALGQWMREKPTSFLGAFAILSVIVFTTSDLLWGTPWWASLSNVIPEEFETLHYLSQFFALQGSKFMMNFIYFLLGAAAFQGNLFKDSKFLQSLKNIFPKALIAMVVLGFSFAIYTVNFPELSMSDLPYQMRRLPDATFGDWLLVVGEKLPGILPRTAALGFLVMAQVIFLLSLFATRYDKATPLWTSLAANAYGIFILHESLVVWLQFYGVNFELSPILKPLLIFAIAFPTSWALAKFLRESLYFKRVLG